MLSSSITPPCATQRPEVVPTFSRNFGGVGESLGVRSADRARDESVESGSSVLIRFTPCRWGWSRREEGRSRQELSLLRDDTRELSHLRDRPAFIHSLQGSLTS